LNNVCACRRTRQLNRCRQLDRSLSPRVRRSCRHLRISVLCPLGRHLLPWSMTPSHAILHFELIIKIAGKYSKSSQCLFALSHQICLVSLYSLQLICTWMRNSNFASIASIQIKQILTQYYQGKNFHLQLLCRLTSTSRNQFHLSSLQQMYTLELESLYIYF
jgi:hypothetical protein